MSNVDWFCWLSLFQCHFLMCSHSFRSFSGITPFLTDWSTHDSMHASSKLPIVGTLTNVSVSAPDDHVVHKLLESPQGLNLSTGSPKLEFTIDTKNGSKTFSSTAPIGISFPEEGGIEVKS